MRNRKVLILISGITLFILVLGISIGIARWQHGNQPLSQQPIVTSRAVNLGFSYLNVTPKLSAAYQLGVDTGALVTEVVPGSPAEQAGIKPGDIILSFNSVRVEAGTPLFGMMQTCPRGTTITLEVRSMKTNSSIELVHIDRDD